MSIFFAFYCQLTPPPDPWKEEVVNLKAVSLLVSSFVKIYQQEGCMGSSSSKGPRESLLSLFFSPSLNSRIKCRLWFWFVNPLNQKSRDYHFKKWSATISLSWLHSWRPSCLHSTLKLLISCVKCRCVRLQYLVSGWVSKVTFKMAFRHGKEGFSLYLSPAI